MLFIAESIAQPMYAVIKTGGKQYKVAKNQVLAVERLGGEPGETVTFAAVLALGDGERTTLGAPLVEGASVAAEVLAQNRGPKVIVFKKQRRKTHRKRIGHRQNQTLVRITDILPGDTVRPPREAEAEMAPPPAAGGSDAAGGGKSAPASEA